MAKLTNDIIDRVRLNTGSKREGDIIVDFLQSALETEPNFEASLGNENWTAVDMWISGRRVGLIFPKKGLVGPLLFGGR